MLTDKEKEIALTCARALGWSDSAQKETEELCDLFLSSIRERQEAVAWIDEYNWLIRKKPISIKGITGTVFKPLFTTPPAAIDCSELVEALESEKRWMQGDPWHTSFDEYERASWRDRYDFINKALANHAKRMKGDE